MWANRVAEANRNNRGRAGTYLGEPNRSGEPDSYDEPELWGEPEHTWENRIAMTSRNGGTNRIAIDEPERWDEPEHTWANRIAGANLIAMTSRNGGTNQNTRGRTGLLGRANSFGRVRTHWGEPDELKHTLTLKQTVNESLTLHTHFFKKIYLNNN